MYYSQHFSLPGKVVWEKDENLPLPFYVSQDKIKKEQVSYRQTKKDLLQFTSDMNFKATQNHKMAEEGRDLWRLSCSTPSL